MKFNLKYSKKYFIAKSVYATFAITGFSIVSTLVSCKSEKRPFFSQNDPQTSGGKKPINLIGEVSNSVTCNFDAQANNIKCSFNCFTPTSTWFCLYNQNQGGPFVFYNECNTSFTTDTCDTKPSVESCYQILEDSGAITLTFLTFVGVHSCP